MHITMDGKDSLRASSSPATCFRISRFAEYAHRLIFTHCILLVLYLPRCHLQDPDDTPFLSTCILRATNKDRIDLATTRTQFSAWAFLLCPSRSQQRMKR